jgi:hypothetical protein
LHKIDPTREALSLASNLSFRNIQELKLFLYNYGRIPRNRRLIEKFGRLSDVVNWVWDGILPESKGWTRASTSPGYEGWAIYRRKVPHQAKSLPTYRCFKIYVCVDLEEIPVASRAFLEVLTASNCACLKVGRTLPYLCRPDHMIAYFSRLDDLALVADLLGPELAGLAELPISFAPRIQGTENLFWGIDRIARKSGQRNQSWRDWVCGLAAMGLGIDDNNKPEQRLATSLTYLKQHGVDPASWILTTEQESLKVEQSIKLASLL